MSSGKIDEFLKKNKDILSSTEKREDSIIGDEHDEEEEENLQGKEDSKIDSIHHSEHEIGKELFWKGLFKFFIRRIAIIR